MSNLPETNLFGEPTPARPAVEYYASFDDYGIFPYGPYPTEAEAIQAAHTDAAAQGILNSYSVYVGQRTPLPMVGRIVAEDFLEDVINDIVEGANNPPAESWPVGTPAQMDNLHSALDAVVRGWLVATGNLADEFYAIQNVKCHGFDGKVTPC